MIHFLSSNIVAAAKKVRGMSPDGEVGLAIRFYAVARQERGHQYVQRSSHGTDDDANISCDKRVEGSSQIGDEKFPISIIRIRLHDKLIGAASLPGYESLLQDWDMDIGPVDDSLSVQAIITHVS